ncbi:peptide chain release factor N(5)-glutamine methyltransferase [Flagellimonas meishanensis]|uniref:peptide chain release factor N(5)-glutamine methyltransferase n=1 Tax=Flagellimonas meishanensis TaxID=2873264 RepID=UPI001CA6DFDE|nr:peptide chain release factor N(5)-glutamine methyltransferase [[Muricauda] meishanensis]
MLLKDIQDIFRKELQQLYSREEIDSFFHRSVEHFLGLERFVLVLRPHISLTKEEEQPLFETLAQLKKEKPIQYILGKAHFMDMELVVNENVLIPRPETEELVQWILDDVVSLKSEVRSQRKDEKKGEDFTLHPSPFSILDIGTGSGCIAIALAKHLPAARVVALDISEKALEVASDNARNNQVDVEFIQQDVLSPELELDEFDVIVSNPPYVREKEKDQMKNNVKAFEPYIALFVPDDDPLKFYRAIIQLANSHLRQKGKLYFEVNQYLGERARELLKAHDFSEIELRKDIFDNHRMLKAIKK